jgi:hypothetical protein
MRDLTHPFCPLDADLVNWASVNRRSFGTGGRLFGLNGKISDRIPSGVASNSAVTGHEQYISVSSADLLDDAHAKQCFISLRCQPMFEHDRCDETLESAEMGRFGVHLPSLSSCRRSSCSRVRTTRCCSRVPTIAKCLRLVEHKRPSNAFIHVFNDDRSGDTLEF